MPRYDINHIDKMRRIIRYFLSGTSFNDLVEVFKKGHFKSIFEDMLYDIKIYLYNHRTINNFDSSYNILYRVIINMLEQVKQASPEQINKYFKENVDIISETFDIEKLEFKC